MSSTVLSIPIDDACLIKLSRLFHRSDHMLNKSIFLAGSGISKRLVYLE